MHFKRLFHEHLSCLLNSDGFQIRTSAGCYALSLFVFVQLYEVIIVQLHIFNIVGLCVTVALHIMALTSSLAPLPTFCLSKLSSHWLPLINTFEFLGGGTCWLAVTVVWLRRPLSLISAHLTTHYCECVCVSVRIKHR